MATLYFKRKTLKFVTAREVALGERSGLALALREYDVVSRDSSLSPERRTKLLAEFRHEIKADGHKIVMLNRGEEPPPRLVGIWVFACTSGGEFIKWGLDGDTKHPYSASQRDEAIEAARYLAGRKTHKDYVFYFMEVFENGQMKQHALD